jgi:antitoxin component YwqK of YwqJK toxin-antitoxin module
MEDQIDGELQKQASLETEIDDELKRQEELLKKIETEQAAKTPAATPGAATPGGLDAAPIVPTDPRTAPPAPTLRTLDSELFDQSKATIEKGQWGDNPKLRVSKRALDADRDGRPEEIRYFDEATGQLLRVELDRNYDGTIDSWTTYKDGAVVRRELDENGDGKPDAFETYANGIMTSREVDRDGDGVRDAFYVYQGDALVEERHDSDNDGKIDLVIHYENKVRVLTEEDTNHDGQIDVWTHYAKDGNGNEVVTKVERDKSGRGKPDTFETFAQQNGKTVLTRREEDANGDGKVDIISVYENGKLKSREVSDPTLVPL